MHLFYILAINFEGKAGLARISKEKADNMREILGKENFTLKTPANVQNFILKGMALLLLDLQCAWALLGIEKNKNPRVIHRNLFLPLTNIIAKWRKIPMVYEVHADFQDEIQHFNKSGLQKLALSLLIRFDRMNFNYASGIIYNHPDLQKALGNKYKKPSIYTYNGVNPKDFYPQDQAVARQALGIDAAIKMNLFLGSVSKWHGVEFIIDAFLHPDLLSDTTQYLYIVGANNSEYVQMLKEKASINPRIIFMPRVGLDKVVSYMNATDLCLMPVNNVRTSPGSPLKLYEYAACGKPILTQEKLAGYEDEIVKYNLGRTTDLTNPAVAAAAIQSFHAEMDKTFYAQNNYAQVTNHLTWNQRMRQWIDFVLTLKR